MIPCKIIQWNARSIKNKLCWLRQSPFVNADILVIQETFLKDSDVISIPGKNILRKDREEDHRGGGLLFAINKKVSYQTVSLNNLPNSKNEIFAVKFYLKNYYFCILNIYSPDGKFDKKWLDTVFSQIPKPSLMLGDFNCQHRAFGAERDTNSSNLIIDWIISNEINIINSKDPTHIDHRLNPSLIDLSLATPDIFPCLNYKVLSDSYFSDHFPILFEINHQSSNYTFKKIINWNNIESEIRTIADTNDNPETICSNLLKKNSKNVEVKQYNNSPWWNENCSKLLANKRRNFSIAIKNCSIFHWKKFKFFEAKLRQVINKKKREYWSNLCEQSGKTKNIFNILKNLNNRKKKVDPTNLIIKYNNLIISDPIQQANLIAENLTLNARREEIQIDFSGPYSPDFDQKFSLKELQKAINNTKNSTPGPDGISASIIKILFQKKPQYLLNYLNKIKEKASPPSNWKVSKIIPITKPGKDPSNVQNYRPIALTSVFCKIFERLLLQRILNFCLKNNIFPKSQTGFIPWRDCSAVHSILFHDIIKARQRRWYHICISLDLSNAYDLVWPEGLIMKMIKRGIHGPTARFIYNLLKDRSFFVQWRKTTSRSFSSSIGIPQGSVLSPILFSLYISDIFDIIPPESRILTFADDIYLFSSNENINLLIKDLQEAINKVEKWCNQWKMRVKPEKCAIIDFSNKKKTYPIPKILIQNHQIPNVPNMKILGIFFSQNLTFNCHLNYLTKKAISRSNALKSIAANNWGARSSDLIKISNLTIRSLFDYGSNIFNSICKTTNKRTNRILHLSLRVSTGLPKRTPLPILYRETNFAPIDIRCKFLANKYYLKQFKLKNMSPIQDLFNLNLEERIRNNPPINKFHREIRKLNVNLNQVLPCMLPNNLEENERYEIHIDNLPFQRKIMDNKLTVSIFNDYVYNEWHDSILIATDASKLNGNIGIAAVNILTNKSYLAQVDRRNSVFTAEAFAMWLALSKLILTCDRYIILTDSQSVLKSLKNVTWRSPSVSLLLNHTIENILGKIKSLKLIWTPAHIGIPPNETADRMAKAATQSQRMIQWITAEDLERAFVCDFHDSIRNQWEESKYFNDYKFIFPSLEVINRYSPNKKMDSLLLKLRSKTLPTNAALYKMKLNNSPKCNFCDEKETSQHILLCCPEHDNARNELRKAIGIIPISFNWICDFSDEPKKKIKALCHFFNSINRF